MVSHANNSTANNVARPSAGGTNRTVPRTGRQTNISSRWSCDMKQLPRSSLRIDFLQSRIGHEPGSVSRVGSALTACLLRPPNGFRPELTLSLGDEGRSILALGSALNGHPLVPVSQQLRRQSSLRTVAGVRMCLCAGTPAKNHRLVTCLPLAAMRFLARNAQAKIGSVSGGGMRRWRGVGELWACISLALFLSGTAVAQQPDASSSASARTVFKALTVERIYSEPSLNGHPVSGIAWAPGSRQLSFFKETPSQRSSDASRELWAMDTTSGEAHLLIAKDKLDSVLADPGGSTQATGLGRHAPPA